MDRVRVFRFRNRQFAKERTRAQMLTDAAPQPAAYAVAVSSPSEIDARAYELARIRDRYHAGGIAAAAMRPRVVRSWERCRELGVDPSLKRAPIRANVDELRTANERLLRAAEPILARLVDAFSGTGYAVIMSDAHGYLLVLAGDPDVRRRLFRRGVEEGADWSEAAAGTNAVGTAVLDRRPLQLLGAEHFCDAPTPFTCTAAPIYAPGTLEVAGVLDISGSYTLVRPHLVGLVMCAALEIEESMALL
jgi:sigma-54 dependent transcriptional regulator, acetoin dehydrogenase operon transcriptional activator AcoR